MPSPLAAACAGAALGTVYIQGSFTTHRYLDSVLLVLVTAIATPTSTANSTVSLGASAAGVKRNFSVFCYAGN